MLAMIILLYLPVVQLREVAGHAPLGLPSQFLQKTKRLLEELQEKRLKLPRHTILHEKLVHTIHRQGAKVACVLSGVQNTVTAETSKVEDGVQSGWSDDVGEGHPAEEVRQTLEREYTGFLGLVVEGEVGDGEGGRREECACVGVPAVMVMVGTGRRPVGVANGDEAGEGVWW